MTGLIRIVIVTWLINRQWVSDGRLEAVIYIAVFTLSTIRWMMLSTATFDGATTRMWGFIFPTLATSRSHGAISGWERQRSPSSPAWDDNHIQRSVHRKKCCHRLIVHTTIHITNNIKNKIRSNFNQNSDSTTLHCTALYCIISVHRR